MFFAAQGHISYSKYIAEIALIFLEVVVNLFLCPAYKRVAAIDLPELYNYSQGLGQASPSTKQSNISAFPATILKAKKSSLSLGSTCVCRQVNILGK